MPRNITPHKTTTKDITRQNSDLRRNEKGTDLMSGIFVHSDWEKLRSSRVKTTESKAVDVWNAQVEKHHCALVEYDNKMH